MYAQYPLTYYESHNPFYAFLWRLYERKPFLASESYPVPSRQITGWRQCSTFCKGQKYSPSLESDRPPLWTIGHLTVMETERERVSGAVVRMHLLPKFADESHTLFMETKHLRLMVCAL